MKIRTRLKLMNKTILGLSLLALVSGGATASDWSNLHAKKQTKLGMYITAEEAYSHTMNHMDQTLFVDIRTPSELNYLGAATVMDAHVPLVFMDTSDWNDKKHRYKRSKNENFVADIDAKLKAKGLSKDDTVILMCRSGKRSATGANMLADAGYKKVYTVVDGYEGGKAKKGAQKGQRIVDGWKNSGLPWTYSLDRDLMHFPNK